MAKSRKEKSDSEHTVKVAIVGGGCAGLAAAWELSKLPGYEVHLYEKSGRLGGKGASGRNSSGRITEHGLHVWLGFYENAFRMMRECYAEVEKRRWGPGAANEDNRLAHGSLDDAFVPEPHIGVAIRSASLKPANEWSVWSGFLPPAEGMPGDPLDEETNPFTLANYLLRCIELLKTLMLSLIDAPDSPQPGKPRPEERSKLDEAIDRDRGFDPINEPEALLATMARYLRGSALTTAAGLLQAVTILETWLQKANLSSNVSGTPLRLLTALAAQVRKQLRDLVGIDQKVRWKTEVIDIVLTIAVGLYRDRVLFSDQGFDAINHIDYREWLKQHGATNTALQSQFLTGIYDLTFAYRNGERKQPALAAGVALRCALRMFFTYRGSMFWRMRSGMGDAVFAPLYKVLKLNDRTIAFTNGSPVTVPPVKFHFLHSLTEVELEVRNGRRYLTRLMFDTQGDPDTQEAASFTALDEFGCWPDGDHLFGTAHAAGPGGGNKPKKLKIGRDFQAVIFATGMDDFKQVCEVSKVVVNGSKETFFENMPDSWRQMCNNVKTVATQAAQVWLDRDLEQLGWRRGTGVFTAYRPPFETWADMTHTLASEKAWRKANGQQAEDGTRSIAYFCGVVPQSLVEAGGATRAKVDDDLDNLLAGGIGPLWPAAGKDLKKHVVDRYPRASVAGSDRYTASLPGSIQYRISPLDASVVNMAIAGDWTASGLDAGCVEAAVMSGMLAAFAITSEKPTLNSITGYDHP